MEVTASIQDWKTDLLQGFQFGVTPIDDREIYDWSSENVELGNAYSVPGFFSVNKSKYMIEPLKALKDLRIRQVNIMASPRTAKTLIGELFLLHTIANNAGSFLWLQSSDEMINKMAELRMMPLLNSCKPVSLLLSKDRFNVTKSRFIFPHMTVHLSSAKIRSLQSIGYKFGVFDEIWMAEPGFLSEFQARFGDFQHTSKILLISQGGDDGTDWQIEFDRSPLYVWGWRCPSCNQLQTLDWNKQREDGSYAGIVWDKIKDENDNWKIQEAAKSARLECFYCKHQLTDVPQNRRYLNDTGDYVCVNPNGDSLKKSFRWNALANIELAFSVLVIEYLQAKEILRREGNHLPIREFHLKRLAQTFKRHSGFADMKSLAIENYESGEKWGDKVFMTIDCQNQFQLLYYVIRAWKKNGESRLLKHGSVNTWEDLRQVQITNSIPDQFVFIDSGFNATTIYAKCIEYSHAGIVGGRKCNLSWIALKGSDKYDFDHPDKVKRLYSTLTFGDPAVGKEVSKGKVCPLYLWSNYTVKNILVNHRDCKCVKWVTNVEDAEYQRHLNSEVLVEEIDKKTNKKKWRWVERPNWANHWFDCEAEQIVAASMCGFLTN